MPRKRPLAHEVSEDDTCHETCGRKPKREAAEERISARAGTARRSLQAKPSLRLGAVSSEDPAEAVAWDVGQDRQTWR